MNARALARLIEEGFSADSAPKPVDDLIFQQLHDEIGELIALEQAAVLKPRVLKELKLRRDELLAVGEDAIFTFNSSSPHMIQGICYSEPHEAPEVRMARVRRLAWVPLLQWMRELTFAQFEDLSAGALQLLGARYAVRTKSTGDQGIDFYGRIYVDDIAPTANPFVRFESDFRFGWLVNLSTTRRARWLRDMFVTSSARFNWPAAMRSG